MFLSFAIIYNAGANNASINLSCSGKILYVGGTGPGNYSSIQEAIDDAEDGDMIFIYSGVYNESVVVNKKVCLVGEDKNTTIIQARDGYAFLIEVSEVSVSRMTVRDSVYPHAGVEMHHVSDVTVSDCVFRENQFGMYITFSEGVKILRCEAVGGQGSVVVLHSSNVAIVGCEISEVSSSKTLADMERDVSVFEGFGLSFDSCNNVTISNNTIVLCEAGIAFWNTSFSRVVSNELLENGVGILVASFSDYNTVEGNCIDGGGYGISVQGGSFNTIANNTVKNCTGWAGIAVIKGWSCGNEIVENKLIKNRVGITIEGKENVVQRNTVSESINYGIYLGSFLVTDCSNNIIIENNFIDNSVSASFCTKPFSSNRWDRNYWSDFTGMIKIIYGKLIIRMTPFYAIEIPWINVDLHPAEQPYDI